MTSMPPALPRRRPETEVGQRSEPVPGSCPACGSRVRPEQPWCTLCHHRLGTTPEPQPETQPAPASQPEPEPQWEPTAPAAGEPPTPAPADRTDPAERAALPVEAMLVELAAVERHSPVPPALSQLVGSGPVGRFALGGAALLAVLTVLVGLFGVVGLFL